MEAPRELTPSIRRASGTFLARNTRYVSYLVLALAMFYGADGLLALLGCALRPAATHLDPVVMLPSSWLLGVLASLAVGSGFALCFADSRGRPARAIGGALAIFALTCVADCAVNPTATLRTAAPRVIVLALLAAGFGKARRLEDLRRAELAHIRRAE